MKQKQPHNPNKDFNYYTEPLRKKIKSIGSDQIIGIEGEISAALEEQIRQERRTLKVAVFYYYVQCGVYLPVIAHKTFVEKLMEKIKKDRD